MQVLLKLQLQQQQQQQQLQLQLQLNLDLEPEPELEVGQIKNRQQLHHLNIMQKMCGYIFTCLYHFVFRKEEKFLKNSSN